MQGLLTFLALGVLALVLLVFLLVFLAERLGVRPRRLVYPLVILTLLILPLCLFSLLFSKTGGSGPLFPTSLPTLPSITPAPSLAQAVQAELARLAKGRILYNPPAQMTQGKEERIEVRVTQSISENL